jgi:diadenosine tetraphosphate (Ap4A) HIT family hydrolase
MQTERSISFFDSFPVSKGHVLVLPKRHVATIWDLSDEEYVDIFDLLKQVKDVVQSRFEPTE